MSSTLPWSLVSVVRSERRDGQMLFIIEVKPAGDDEAYFLGKRYNMFAHLRSEVKSHLKGVMIMPFPPKLGTNIEQRRRMLDDWLAEVVSCAREESHAALRPLLYEFLAERTAETTALGGTEFIIEAVKMPEYEDRDGTTWFAIDACSLDSHLFRIWKTYSMFAHFQKDVDFNPAIFPKKGLTKCTGEALEERRQQLVIWFTQLISASEADEQLKPKIQDFLVPQTDSPVQHSNEVQISCLGILAARLTDVAERGGAVYYKVEVVPAESHEPYFLWKRYSMFLNLCDSVVHTTGDPNYALDFPSKLLSRGEKSLDHRKRALDFWLTSLFDAAGGSDRELLRPLLQQFLHESEKMPPVLACSSETEVSSVSVPSYHDRQGTIFYTINCHLSTGADYSVAKSYSMFHELAQSCAQCSIGQVALSGFPPKSFLKMTNKESLNYRLHALSKWFVAMFERSQSADYDDVKPWLKRFLNPHI
ncbi:hypothetical protein DIPPA_14330 [Diplonema papillatum]|nr:hypothetical protein DIPPA_14330 [Diplonema papillatum]